MIAFLCCRSTFAHSIKSSQVEIIYRAGTGVSPRKKAPAQNVSARTSHRTNSSNGAGSGVARSSSFANNSRLAVTKDQNKPRDTNTSTDDVPSSQAGSNKLAGTSATRSITDTASNVLNTKLDEGTLSILQ